MLLTLIRKIINSINSNAIETHSHICQLTSV